MGQPTQVLCPKRLDLLKSELMKQGFEEPEATRRAEEILATKATMACQHVNPDGTFKGGFEGCVDHFMTCKGLPKENAEKMCAYIGRAAGKIP